MFHNLTRPSKACREPSLVFHGRHYRASMEGNIGGVVQGHYGASVGRVLKAIHSERVLKAIHSEHRANMWMVWAEYWASVGNYGDGARMSPRTNPRPAKVFRAGIQRACKAF